MEFSCVKDCSQCCIDREYYPTKEFGKIGVLILPEEKDRIESLARQHLIQVKIMPRIGISHNNSKPDQVLAYQMMGREQNGNTCPFLDTDEDARSPHGGFSCKIYEQRPLACRAYPLIGSDPIKLDQKCKFCQVSQTADSNLDIESLVQIQTKMTTTAPVIWRYATGIGEPEDRPYIKHGWMQEI